MEQEIQVIESQAVSVFGSERPADIVSRATEVANVLSPIVEQKKLYKMIGPKKHVYAEGWTAMLSLIGVFPISEYSRRIEREGEIAYEARVVLKTLNGQIVGAGEAICSSKEKNWSARDEYAIKSMAQTRATGKACRLPFSWIMTLAGYEACPAEEMEGVVHEPIQQPRAKPAPVVEAEDNTDPFAPEDLPKPSGVKTISEKQRKMLWAKCRAANVPENIFKSYIKENFLVEHTDELPWTAMDPTIKWIDAYANLAKG